MVTIQSAKSRVCGSFVGCAVVTTAHWLGTILSCDRILVLDAAQVAEIDAPQQLLQVRSISSGFTSGVCADLEGCMMVTIAHRLGTILNCDCILVLEAGQVAERVS